MSIKFKIDFQFELPHRGFRRVIGTFAGSHISPEGKKLTKEQWDKRVNNWLPTDSDREFVISLQKAVVEPGKIASWVAPPTRGIDGHPFDFEYVRFN